MHLTPWQADIPQLIGPQDDTNKIGQQIKLSSNLCILKIVSFNSINIMLLWIYEKDIILPTQPTTDHNKNLLI